MPMENSEKKKIYCLALVAIVTSWSSRRSGESEFCGKVMNLASTGTEMDFLSQPVNQPQETNTREKFWNGLYLLQLYEKCIKNNSQGFVFQSPVFLSVQTNRLKKKLMFVIKAKAEAVQFSQQAPEVSRQHPPRERCSNTLSFHNAPKSQRSDLSPIIQVSFWDVSLYNAWCRWTKGVNMKICEVHSIEEHWSALKNPARSSCVAAGMPGRDGLWTLSWCLMTTACRKASHRFRLPAEVSEGIWRNDVHASVKCLTCSRAFSASF